MDTRTGKIVGWDEVQNLPESERKFYKEMTLDPSPEQLDRKPPKVGRNEPCPCGSKKKFKKCCLISPRQQG